MTNKYSRAQRRADYVRLKEKRQFHWGYGKNGWRTYCTHNRGTIYNMSTATSGMVANTPTPCSCYMCGNPRRNSWGENPLTLQEQRADAAFKDGIEEYADWKHPLNPWWEYEEMSSFEEIFYGEDPADDWYLRWMYIKDQ